GLLNPTGESGFIKWFVFEDVVVAGVLTLRLNWRHRSQRQAPKEGYLDVLGETVKAEEPALAFETVEGGVPFHPLVNAGNRLLDHLGETTADSALPTRHGRDVVLNRTIPITLRNLRIAPGQEL